LEAALFIIRLSTGKPVNRFRIFEQEGDTMPIVTLSDTVCQHTVRQQSRISKPDTGCLAAHNRNGVYEVTDALNCGKFTALIAYYLRYSEQIIQEDPRHLLYPRNRICEAAAALNCGKLAKLISYYQNKK
jgi:hypothetical protein